MSDPELLLELIEKGVVEHGGDLGGWTHRSDDKLQLFDGRVTLRAELKESGPSSDPGVVHAHVLTTLHEHDDEVLDACLLGMGKDREAALGQSAAIWMTGVAGPIKSFLDNKPACTTCEVSAEGVDTLQGRSPGDYGLSGVRAYVGPVLSRGFDEEQDHPHFDDTMPWFRFAAEAAAPRRVHLVKAIVLSKGKDGWDRRFDIDGHDVSFHDLDWPTRVTRPDSGYLTRFAVFEFPSNAEISRRAELESAIRFFAESFAKYDSIDSLVNEMVNRSFDPDLVHETACFAPIAFSRTLFEPRGIQYSATVIRARRDGRVETDVPLMSIPAYARARVLAAHYYETLPEDDFLALSLYDAESGAILKAMEALGDKLDFTRTKMSPRAVPYRGASEEAMNAALAVIGRQRKPWWKFW